ncbi:MAG: hypothetical protein HZA08_04995 [Nitrospirae bacterium]|nr:hypothetical protein [Nitrospirota bacterium]
MNRHEPWFTKGHENQRDKNVPPILIDMDRRVFSYPAGEIFERIKLPNRDQLLLSNLGGGKL